MVISLEPFKNQIFPLKRKENEPTGMYGGVRMNRF